MILKSSRALKTQRKTFMVECKVSKATSSRSIVFKKQLFTGNTQKFRYTENSLENVKVKGKFSKKNFQV